MSAFAGKRTLKKIQLIDSIVTRNPGYLDKIYWIETRKKHDSANVRFPVPFQPVAATHVLNLSAGVS